MERLGPAFLRFLLQRRPEFRVRRNGGHLLPLQQGPNVLAGAPSDDWEFSSGRDIGGGFLGEW